MHLIGQHALGVVILVLLGLLVVVKRLTTGNVLKDTPRGGMLLWAVHVFNMFFLLVANPAAGILLAAGRLDQVDVTRLTLPLPVAISLEAAGIGLTVLGYFLMGWALVTLGRGYQVGGSDPRPADRLVVHGPYGIVRHPMYAAALCISLGLALATQSLALLAVTVVYLALILPLMPFEETRLRSAYGDQYVSYSRSVRRVVPFVY